MTIYLEYRGYSVELPQGETVVGRDVACTLRFDDASVSRRHVMVSRNGDDVFVQDLGSTNGSFLNGDPIATRTPLRDRDAIEIGGHQLILRVADDTAEQRSTRRVTNFRELGKMNRAPAKRPAPPTQPSERRRHDRAPVELRLVYTSSALEIEAVTRDLSLSGVFVVTEVFDPPGTSCQLQIFGDGGAPLELQGIVRRVVERAPTGLAIEFVGLGEHQRAWLELVTTRRTRTTTIEKIDPV